jgi:pyruvate dehydrogenase E1 component beta subunit
MLEAEDISVEVLDLRSLVPLDKAALLDSVRRTGRLVVLHEASRSAGFGAELAAIVAEEAFGALKAPIRRVTAPDVPVPVSPPLEAYCRPGAEDVAAAVRAVVSG